MSKVGVENSESENNSAGTLDLSEESATCKKRVPKRILHFSDGTLEEFSSDEDDIDMPHVAQKNSQLLHASMGHISWVPWFWYQTVFVGSKALAVCDYLGESIANFFGIISPKYEYEIERYKRAIAEEIEREKEDTELGSWSTRSSASTQVPVQSEPQRY